MKMRFTPFRHIANIRVSAVVASALVSTLLLFACGGGSGGGASSGVSGSCDFAISSQPQSLAASEVERILAQGAEAANKIGVKATISVVDRVGNVLAVYKMNGAKDTVNVLSGLGRSTADKPQGLDGLSDLVPSGAAAIAKAVTGAYLSSSGNAFSTRTASFIIQDHFPPGIIRQAGGPLFGVQFSQLPCGDFVTRGEGVGIGPKRSPLGLAGDPGGFPIYKNGRVVGGIGVMADGVYGLDLDPQKADSDLDERIALSALKGFAAPDCIRADHITAGGISLPYSTSDSQIVSVTANSLADTQVSSLGGLIAVPTYFGPPGSDPKASPIVLAGTAFGEPASGIAPDPATFKALRGYVLVDGAKSVNRYPASSSKSPASSDSGGLGLSSAEVKEILGQTLGVANQARAQIRSPLGSPAEVTISIVDVAGNVLGVVRTPDAPVFGTDVSLQKARTAAFFSSPNAASALSSLPDVGYFNGMKQQGPKFTIDSYLSDPTLGARTFFGSPKAFADGVAFSNRAIGNIARPNFPDGIDGNPKGPFSKSINTWSPFNVGLQLDIVYSNFVGAILDGANTNTNCTGADGIAALKNGIQIFPGSFPVYRGNVLIGAVGVSGDGVDQDDMISFLGLSRAGKILNTGVANAPQAMRSDTLMSKGLRLRYAQCPQGPFNNSNDQNVCDGI